MFDHIFLMFFPRKNSVSLESKVFSSASQKTSCRLVVFEEGILVCRILFRIPQRIIPGEKPSEHGGSRRITTELQNQ